MRDLLPKSSLGYRGLFAHSIPFGVILAIHLALAWAREQPLYMADEAGYLANARYLSGAAPMPTFHGSHFYPFGYSLFIIPAFRFFDSPFASYSASLVIGAVLMSTVYFSLYYLLAPLLGTPKRVAMFAACVTCLYPPLLLRANFAWAEAAYVPAFMLLVAVFGALLRYKTMRLALAFGLLLGFMYTIHSRSLALLPVGVLYLAALGYLRTLSWQKVGAAISGTALVFVATRVVVEHLRHAGGGAVPEISVGPVIAHLLTFEGILDLLLKVNEQAFYLSISTFGLFFVGILAAGRIVAQSKRTGLAGLLDDAACGTLVFFVLAWLATLVLSAAFLGSIKDEAQFLIGRFIDGISAPLIALGIAGILLGCNRWSHRRAVILAVILAASTFATVFSLSDLLTNTFEPGVYAFFALLGESPSTLIVASGIAAAGYVACTLARGRWRFLPVAAVTALFLLSSAFAYSMYVLPLQERVARSSTLPGYIRAYLGSPPAIAYDTASYHPLAYFSYEFLLPHTRFIPFNSAAGESPPAPIVIAGHTWPAAAALNAHFWQAEPIVPLIGADQALWTLPGPQQTALIRSADYANSVLGHFVLPSRSIDTIEGKPVQPLWGVWQHGFFHPTGSEDAVPPVWVSARATIRIPTAGRPPRALLLNLVSTVDRATALRVHANGETLYADTIPPGSWCRLLPLQELSESRVTTVELSQPPSTTDTNAQSAIIVVRGITVLDHVPEMQRALSTDPLPSGAYRSRLASLAPLYPQVLPRGAMSTLRLSVTNAGNEPWPTPCETGQTPGTVQLGILWFPQNSANRSLSAVAAESRAALPYALAPGNAITLTAVLAPIKQNGARLPPGDYEVWIGPVQEGVSWFFQHGDDVLKVPVRVVR